MTQESEPRTPSAERRASSSWPLLTQLVTGSDGTGAEAMTDLTHALRPRHETAEERIQCKREQRTLGVIATLILLSIFAIVIVVDLAWSAYVYGDWKCAFAECRKVTK